MAVDLFPADPEIEIPAPKRVVRAFVDDEEVFFFSSHLFDPNARAASDGSAVQHRWPELSRAAWAVVQYHESKWTVLRGTNGPDMKQAAVTVNTKPPHKLSGREQKVPWPLTAKPCSQVEKTMKARDVTTETSMVDGGRKI